MNTFLTKTITFTFVLTTLFLIACGGGQKKQTPPPAPPPKEEKLATARSFNMGQTNEGLSSVTYSPASGGYTYKDIGVSQATFKSWSGKNLPALQSALNAAGDGYQLQVVGHTCSQGPRTAQDGKKGNVWYSTERAKSFADALVNGGLPKDKVTYTGIADDELLEGLDSEDQRHRRVTFRIISNSQ